MAYHRDICLEVGPNKTYEMSEYVIQQMREYPAMKVVYIGDACFDHFLESIPADVVDRVDVRAPVRRINN